MTWGAIFFACFAALVAALICWAAVAINRDASHDEEDGLAAIEHFREIPK